MRKFKNLVLSFVTKGHKRSVKAKKNIVASFMVKAVGIAISLAVVPLTLNYVDAERYGIWLTLSSIVAWFSFFDIGISHGLRNKFAEAKATGNHELAQTYVSTTYAVLGLIFLGVWLLFVIVNPFLDWTALLGIDIKYGKDLSTLALILFTYFCLQFVLRTVAVILSSDQEPSKAAMIDVIGQFIALLIIAILVKTTQGSLVKLGLALCIAPIVALLGANIMVFKNKYREYRPLLGKVDFKQAKGLFNLGLVFFVIQIAGLVQFQSANVIISRNFGPEDVTAYNIVYKYFGVLQMGFMIFLTPFWSATTEAFVKEDYNWIKNGIKKYNLLNLLFVFFGLCMFLVSGIIYELWLGENTVHIDTRLSFWGMIFSMFAMYGSKYVSFLNGISALRIQFIASIISPIFYILIALVLIKFWKLGVYSIFIAATLANFNAFILAPLQYHKIINLGKRGIWIK